MHPIKYKTEQEFCSVTTKLLLGMLIGKRRIIAVPEVPWGYFSNEQVDMLLLDVKNKEYLPIEYKLNNLEKLKRQIEYHGNALGIINTDTKDGNCRIFGYTGKDAQLDQLDRYGVGHKHWWSSIYGGYGMIYYWAYKNRESRFDGGRTGGSREGFATVYMEAIENLHKQYPHLDFMITHAALSSGYSISTSRKYFRQALSGIAPAAGR